MDTETFNTRLSYGEEGEHIVANLFLSQSCFVTPFYQFNPTAAPAILHRSGSVTAPDLTVYKNGQVLFVEVKRKTRWVTFNGIETGINFEHFQAYKQLADSTGVKVFLFFIHEEQPPHGIYYADINTPYRYWDGKTSSGQYIQKPMVFFPSESLKRYA